MQYSVEEARELIGLSRVPKGGVPAAWWVTTDQDQIEAYERWHVDYLVHCDKVDAMAKSLGLDGAEDAFLLSFGSQSRLTGFRVKTAWRRWHGDPGHEPLPAGWRWDKKADRLVPSRKTKADRESQINKDFLALLKVPDVHSYVSGLPSEIYLEDRDFGGTIYRTHFRRGENCVWAYSGGDPDRSPDLPRLGAKGDQESKTTGVWHRQKLSVLIALQEEVADAKARA